jgi:putative FmdB family regulatory protein
MPTYDYECNSCGHRFELFQSITAKPIRKCPECGTLKAQRLIGAGASVIFKGSGFYETDYRSENYKKGAKQDSDASKPKDKSDSASTSDSTPKDKKKSTPKKKDAGK